MSKRRTFTPEFKAQAVLEELTGVKDKADICREYRLRPQVFNRWREEFLERAREIVQLTKYVQLSNALIIGVAIGCPCLILFLALVGPSISCPLYHQVVVRNATLAKSTVVIAAVGLCLGLVATLFPRFKRRGKVV